MIDIVEILVHWHAGRSRNEIAASLGVDRKTIRKYLAPAEAAGLTPGGPGLSETEWAARVRGWFPELADTRLRQVTWPAIGAHHEFITGQLRAGVRMSTIHQRLVDEHGLAVSVASLRRYIRANVAEEARRAGVTVRALTPTEAGEQAQVDYGRLGMWTDPVSGRRRTVWAFVMVLAFSRHMFVRPVLTMDSHAWTVAHVEAFGFFGGAPGRLVPDNLRTGVDRSDLYDPKLNRAYAELAAHYGVLIDPARAFKPRDKPHVERQMPYVRDSFWRGRDFASLPEMRAAALTWCIEVAGARACRPLDGAAPLAVFTAAEREALRPLPPAPFVAARWSTAKVGPDIHARVDGVLYSLPWRYLGQTVHARQTAAMVQFFVDGQLVKTHPRKDRGKQTDLNDYPPEKIAFHLRTPTWCRTQAEKIGPACVELIAALLADNALYRLRAAQGVIGLAERHDPGRLEAACVKAITVGDPSYRTVKGILAAGTERAPAPPSSGDGGAAAFLHGPQALFADVIPLAVPPTATGTDPATTTGPDPAEEAS
ncbi:IS21 family transposase [Frankia sp. CeD]|uniref:IS21 family transposase n=1 Tax=Frankia sp. CeD TaxID=258230 RepID=UPI0004DD3192|nr:IS21 family transposase [Frankia sp. CeD]KEZ37577.1 transposase [Frankia sp. CeD]